MRVSISGDLNRIIRRFRAVPGSRVQVVVSAEGLDIIANAEGYRTLARWCLVMAHPQMEQAHPRWLFALRKLDEALSKTGRLTVTSRRDGVESPLSLRDIRFYRTHSEDGGFIEEESGIEGRS